MNFAKNDKILVTGSTGLIGTALINHLKLNGYENVVGLSSVHADLSDYQSTLKIFQEIKPKVVFHLAARVYGIMGNMSNKGLSFFDNIRINTNVIESARLVNAKKIIAMGSTAVYSDNIPLPMAEEQIWNGPPHHSEISYAQAKRAMLAHLEAYEEQYGLKYAYCISTNLFGPHDKFDEKNGHVIPSLICKFHKAIQTNEPVTVWGTGTPTRDFLYSADAAQAMILIAENFNGPINLASGISNSIKTTVEILREVSNYSGDVIWDHSKPDGQKVRQYNVDKLANIGFKPNFSFKKGLADTFDWYCRNYEIARR